MEGSFTGSFLFITELSWPPRFRNHPVKGAYVSLSFLTASCRHCNNLISLGCVWIKAKVTTPCQNPKVFKKGCIFLKALHFFSKIFIFAFIGNINYRKSLWKTVPSFNLGLVIIFSLRSWLHATQAIKMCKPDTNLKEVCSITCTVIDESMWKNKNTLVNY